LGLIWVKLGLNWVRFGFVFIVIVHSSWFVVHCDTNTYVHLSIQQIGFVLHKLLFLIDFLPQRLQGTKNTKKKFELVIHCFHSV